MYMQGWESPLKEYGLCNALVESSTDHRSLSLLSDLSMFGSAFPIIFSFPIIYINWQTHWSSALKSFFGRGGWAK